MALKRLKTCIVALCAALSFAPGAQARDSLTIGISQFPSTFHPSIDSMMAKTYILSMARRPITTTDADWNLVCVLCVELPTIENGLARPEKTPDGKDGVAITYKLRDDIRWGDGTPVTTRDVLFTWEVGRHPKSGVGNAEAYRRILSIDIHDDYSFTLHNEKLEFEYNNVNQFYLLPEHLERQVFEASPVDYKNTTLFQTDTTNPGLYFGPYQIAAVQPGTSVELVENPTWFGARPNFGKISVKAIGNTAAMEANLLSGSIDMIAGELGVTIDQAIAFEQRHRDRFDVIYKPGLVYEHIDLNLDNPILQDVRVRRALLRALDRKTLSEQLFAGKQPPAETSINPLDWIYTDDLPDNSYSPDAAIALLAEAGWTDMRNGIRHNAAGEPLRFEIMTTAGNRTRELVEQVLQSQWKAVGIDVRIRNQPARVFFGQTVTQREFTAMAMFAWISAPESVPRTTLHSTYIPTAENNYAGQNYTGYVSPEMDKLIDEVEVELDRDKRKIIWTKIQQIYASDLPALPLYFRADAFILPKWLKGVRPTGHQYPSSLEIETWHAAD
ncbi:peptide ABC transporter substrate-binding protein [Alphaproteobacteria bacterium HT1-32]|nr:peptide ABC transporter substrate-binding protein [Alphaproteobacteria bacterium HT1-32]